MLERFGSDLSGLRIAVDCANGAYAGIAPRAFERLGARWTAIGNEPDGTNINVGCGATDLGCAAATSLQAVSSISVSRSTATATACSPSTPTGDVVDGDQIVAILALDLGVDLVAVTTMTNLGFHRLMEQRGIRVVTTDVGDRYVLEALYREGGVLGGEQSGHIIYLRDHVTGDGLAAALLLCGAVRDTPLAEAAARDGALSAGEAEPAAFDRGPLPQSLARCRRARERRARRPRPCARAPVGHGARRARARRGPDAGGVGSPLW